MRLNVGRVYAVTSEHGCSVTFADGSPCATIPAGGGTFVAQAGEMLVSDADAVVRELPNGEEVLHGQMLEAQPETGVNLMKYAHCRTVDDVLAVNADYKLDLCGDREWLHELPEMVNLNSMFCPNSGIRRVVLNIPKATHIGWLFQTDVNSDLEEVFINAPAVTNKAPHVFQPDKGARYAKLRKVVLLLPEATSINMLIWYAPLTSIELHCPKISSATQAFTNTQLDKQSVLHILGQLRNFDDGATHKIDMGIHVDHQHDDEVLAAIANAEAKGWTVSVQWTGKPTAQAAVTYGLRKPPIYAREGEVELPDGTTERVLDWGHYVTDETGYETFRSVEAAREYFGLPDEHLTNN